MRRSPRFQQLFLPILTLSIALLSQGAWAQATTGSIVGWVSDPSKAAIAGAQVVAVNQDTGVHYTNMTGSEGSYVLLNLPPGTYDVTVTHSGFEATVVRGVRLVTDQKQLLDFAL